MNTEADVIRSHLMMEPTQVGTQTHYSGYVAGLRYCREATGRNLRTGNPEETGLGGSWLGAMGYMALLDQVGRCFKRRGSQKVYPRDSSVVRALSEFSILSDNEILALYALRNAFMHEFGLWNEHKNPLLQHRFLVVHEPDRKSPLPTIILPKNGWNGKPGDAIEHSTIVDLGKFCDLVEGINRTLCELAGRGELEIILSGGAQELKERYSFFSEKKTIKLQ